ncbi:nitrilase-related carbon-nitrogen hydrolase [Phycisphaerales bacterium ac7]
MIRAHLLQMDLAWEDRGSNFAKVGSMLGGIELNPGDLVVLPELFDSGFSLNVDRTADVAPIGHGETQCFLAGLVRERGVFVHGSWTGLVEPDAGARGLNMASLFAPSGEELYRYAKIHPFTYGREGERFDGGGEVVCADVAFRENEALRVCPAVCYDLRFPELFRRGLDLGAEVFVIGATGPRRVGRIARAQRCARDRESGVGVVRESRRQ